MPAYLPALTKGCTAVRRESTGSCDGATNSDRRWLERPGGPSDYRFLFPCFPPLPRSVEDGAGTGRSQLTRPDPALTSGSWRTQIEPSIRVAVLFLESDRRIREAHSRSQPLLVCSLR